MKRLLQFVKNQVERDRESVGRSVSCEFKRCVDCSTSWRMTRCQRLVRGISKAQGPETSCPRTTNCGSRVVRWRRRTVGPFVCQYEQNRHALLWVVHHHDR